MADEKGLMEEVQTLDQASGEQVLHTSQKVCGIKRDTVMAALKEAQAEFDGEAQRLGLESEQDVAALVKQVRYSHKQEAQDKE